jgi:hypothetical protein
MSFTHFLAALAALTVLTLLTFFGLQQLHMSTGSLVDWLVGVVVLWWLAVVTVLPWNAHFAALHVVEQARDSRANGIAVAEDSVAYASQIAQRFKWLAVGLHLGTALLLGGLAYFRVVAVGYPAAAAALVLTGARPAQRAYEHLSARLRHLADQMRYPREDVAELRARLHQLEEQSRATSQALNAERKGSWAHDQALALAALGKQLDRLDGRLEEEIRQNARAHEALTRQTSTEIARLSEDARFLNQVRDLIKFVKQA